jgi:hypothetical protein
LNGALLSENQRERERATAMAESNDSVFVDVEKIYLGGKVFCFSFGFVFFFFLVQFGVVLPSVSMGTIPNSIFFL